MSDSKVSIHNGVPLRGDLKVVARDAVTGEIVRRIEIRNTITYLALGTLVELIAQKTSTLYPFGGLAIATLRVGSGTIPPTRNDSSLGSEVHSLALNDANKFLTTNNPFELKIAVTLEAGTSSSPFNNVTLSEAGLFTAGDVASGLAPRLFARQIHPGIPKSTALVIDYDWRIAFTA